MKFNIVSKKSYLKEQVSPDRPFIFQVDCNLKLSKEADREVIKNNVRAHQGITVVTTIPGSEKITDEYSYVILRVKFQPYQTPPVVFLRNLKSFMRKLSRSGLTSFHFSPESLKKTRM